MGHVRRLTRKKSVFLPIFMLLFFFLAVPPPAPAARDGEGQKKDASVAPAAAENTAPPAAVEKVSTRPGKRHPVKTVWLVAALVAVTGVVAYLVLAGSAKGSMDVRSSPAGAAILIDGSDTGKTTPALLGGIKAGEHVLTLKKNGLQDFTLTITVEKNKTATVNAEMLALAMSEDFQDSVADHWQNNGLGTWDIINGVYRFRGSSSGSGTFAYSWYDLGSYAEFTCQARIRNGGDNGLAFRGNPTSGEWYVFYAWGSQWAVFHYTTVNFDYLVNYTYSSALKPYPELNEFKVAAKGANFGFYINGILVGSAYDTRLALGKIGFQVRDYPGVTQEYDDISISLSTPSATPALVRTRLPRHP